MVIGRLLFGIVALLFFASGIDHFVSYGALAEYYASLGWPPSVTEVIGVAELVGAVLLLIPKVQRVAAVLLIGVLVALLTRQLIRGQEMVFFLEPAFWMIVALGIGLLLLSYRVRRARS